MTMREYFRRAAENPRGDVEAEALRGALEDWRFVATLTYGDDKRDELVVMHGSDVVDFERSAGGAL